MLNILKKSEKKVWRRCEKRGTLQPSKLFKIEQLFPLKFFSENFFFSFLAHLRVSFLAFFPFHLKIWIIIKSQGEKWESLFQFSWRCISAFGLGVSNFSLVLWARHPSLKADQGSEDSSSPFSSSPACPPAPSHAPPQGLHLPGLKVNSKSHTLGSTPEWDVHTPDPSLTGFWGRTWSFPDTFYLKCWAGGHE